MNFKFKSLLKRKNIFKMEIANSVNTSWSEMLLEYVYFKTILVLVAFYFFDSILNVIYIIFSNFCKYYKLYRNFKNISGVNCCGLVKKCSKIAFNYMSIRFFSWINGNLVKKVDKNMYEVSFVIGSKVYKVFVEHSRNPSDILQIVSDGDEDVTELYEPFLNFRYIHLKPSLFKHKNIEIMLSDGDSKEYGEEDLIEIEE
jgi:hypothetical protein